MDHDRFQQYVDDRYYPQLRWYSRRSHSSQRIYKSLQFLLITLSSLTPVLIVIEKLTVAQNLAWLFWLPATVATIVAILTATIRAFHFQENWIGYRTTCEALKKELYLYRAEVGAYGQAPDREALFVERTERLIARENTLWLAVQQPAKPLGSGAE